MEQELGNCTMEDYHCQTAPAPLVPEKVPCHARHRTHSRVCHITLTACHTPHGTHSTRGVTRDIVFGRSQNGAVLSSVCVLRQECFDRRSFHIAWRGLTFESSPIQSTSFSYGGPRSRFCVSLHVDSVSQLIFRQTYFLQCAIPCQLFALCMTFASREFRRARLLFLLPRHGLAARVLSLSDTASCKHN